MPISVLLSHAAFAVFLFALGAGLTRVMIAVGIHDIPNERSSHTEPTPRSGGIAVTAVFFVGVLVLYFMSDVARLPPLQFGVFLALAFGLFVFALTDDLVTLSASVKLVVQIVAAGTFAAFVAHVGVIAVPGAGNVELSVTGYLLTVLWIIFFMNAFNFMDGINGMAGGAAIISGLFLMAISFFAVTHFVYLTSLALVAAVLGFYVFNFPGGRIFLGDSGSQVLGFLFAGLAIIGARADVGQVSVFVVPALFYPFLVDVLFTLTHRAWRRRRLMEGHREHAYQLLNRMGLSHVRVSVIYYGLFIASGTYAAFVQSAPPEARLPLFVVGFVVLLVPEIAVYRRARREGLLPD